MFEGEDDQSLSLDEVQFVISPKWHNLPWTSLEFTLPREVIWHSM